jgi:uncharacterized protein (TIGR02246 family)
MSFLVSLVLAVSMLPTAPAASPAPGGSVEEQVKAVEEQLRAAAVKGDTATFERLMLDDYTNTNAWGLTRTRAELIADVKSGAGKTESLQLDNVRVRTYGDVAILTADRTAKSTLRGQDTSGRFRQMRVYVKKDGQWRAAAMQFTPIR